MAVLLDPSFGVEYWLCNTQRLVGLPPGQTVQLVQVGGLESE